MSGLAETVSAGYLSELLARSFTRPLNFVVCVLPLPSQCLIDIPGPAIGAVESGVCIGVEAAVGLNDLAAAVYEAVNLIGYLLPELVLSHILASLALSAPVGCYP
jgi:hypothetical protein